MSEEDARPPILGVDDTVLEQHRVIRDFTQRIEKVKDLRELITCLHEFRALLLAHFRLEEQPDGLYDSIRATSPRHYGRLDQLAKEHEAFRASIDDIVARSRAVLAGPVAEVLAATAALARRLRRHEATEDAMLTDALYTDLGQGD